MAMKPIPGFVGASYYFEDDVYSAVERTQNWFLSINQETGVMSLEPTPANAPFSPLPVPAPFNQPNRGMVSLRGRAMGVNGNVAFAIDNTGTYTNLGAVKADTAPARFSANGNNQLTIASAGKLYVVPPNGQAGSLISLENNPDCLGAIDTTAQDGYNINIVPDSNKFQISGNQTSPVGDSTVYDQANVSVQAGQSDNLRAVISWREFLRVFGYRRTQVLDNVGNTGIGGFPFVSYNQTFIETGIAATASLCNMGNSLMWLGEEDRGRRSCWRDFSQNPQPASTLAIENIWSKYGRIDDAYSFPVIFKGHLWYVTTFPSAVLNNPPGGFFTTPSYTGRTWVYDATMSDLLKKSIWFEMAYHNAMGFDVQRAEAGYCFAYGKHLVGSNGVDGNPGAVYEWTNAVFQDCGVSMTGAQTLQPHIPMRIVPHISASRHRIKINRIEFAMKQGVGLDGGVPGSTPYLYMQISRDGGKTYGVEHIMNLGKIGHYDALTYMNKLGAARNWVFKIYGGDPVYYGCQGASIDAVEMAS